MRREPFFTLSVVAVSVLAASALAGCSTPVSTPESSPSGSSNPSDSASPSSSPSGDAEFFVPGAPANQCLSANLAASVEGPYGSAGHLNYRVVFTNNGPECALEGFPGVAIGDAGHQVGAAADQLGADSNVRKVVTLATGGIAVSHLSTVTIDPDGGALGAQCTLGHGDEYSITPPHSFEVFSIAAPDVAACTNGTVWMTVDPVEAG